MKSCVICIIGFIVWGTVAAADARAGSAAAVVLPPGVTAVWDMGAAQRDTTPTRERICINGLWQWQPASAPGDTVPSDAWGYFKVPGCWPGLSDYLQKDCQTLYPHPSWRGTKPGSVTAAWYQRDIRIPDSWKGRRVTLTADYVNSYAGVYVDGRKVGEILFPSGEVDLTAACAPGEAHTLSLHVVAMPLAAVIRAYRDSAAAKDVKGVVQRRGLCGDVYLVGAPPAARVEDVRIDPSVQRSEVTFDAALRDLAADSEYALRARITDGGREVAAFTSRPFHGRDAAEGHFAFSAKWKPQRLWDLNTPGNQFDAQVSLIDAAGKVLDTGWSTRFGFRELWIDGRDFYLNGTRLWLSVVPLDNAQSGAAWATYDAARETFERLQAIGINCVYTHHYDCQPGAHLSLEEILRAADDTGMLVALTQPHFAQYDWKAPDADQQNGYARHAAFYARVAGNHPSVVFYATSHNACGYGEDMNPDLLASGEPARDSWAANNVKLALRAERLIHHADPSRIVYHHAGGDLGSMDTVNFYANFAPVQEMSDWFGHWAAQGRKPLLLCEYGVPFTWDWTMYRGWYHGQREFGSAAVPWEFCVAEWDAQFLGDRAYNVSEAERANLRWEAKQFRAGKVWHRWDYPNDVGSSRFPQRYEVFAKYLSSNWRAFRTWGVSGTSPWEYGSFWTLRDGVDRSRKAMKVDWAHLQRPGFSPDYVDQRPERMDLAFERGDWVATPAATALVRNNQPTLAYIAGKASEFTSKTHLFQAGETVEKQLILINNARHDVTCDCKWTLDLPQPVSGAKQLVLATGEMARVPLRFEVPTALGVGRHELKARVEFSGGDAGAAGGVQEDTFAIDVLAPQKPIDAGANVALFDPAGETGAWLDHAGVRYRRVDAGADLASVDLLILGKRALSLDGAAPNVSRVRDGMKLVMFEQTPAVLEQRLGFRVAEYGLRQVFPRIPDHALLSGVGANALCDWRGDATILPARLQYELRPQYGPTVSWCGLRVPRVWRCGNRGDVASALIEKPAAGDFRPIVDGGYSLQYSPLIEHREGKGVVLLCQLDVTGRTAADPAAETLARNVLRYAATWKPAPLRHALYAGDPAGKRHLEACGVRVETFGEGANGAAGALTGLAQQVLVAGPGAERVLAPHAAEIATWLKGGGNLLAIGLDEGAANAFLPFHIATRSKEHIACTFDPPAQDSLLAGVSPADVHNRDPRDMPLVQSGAVILGDGVLARAEGANVVFCQIIPWQFAEPTTPNVKRTYRRTSALLTRLLANMGVDADTPLLERIATPVAPGKPEHRWTNGLYLDQPEEWDDPYRFFRW